MNEAKASNAVGVVGLVSLNLGLRIGLVGSYVRLMGALSGIPALMGSLYQTKGVHYGLLLTGWWSFVFLVTKNSFVLVFRVRQFFRQN